jgi:hypothetical protein
MAEFPSFLGGLGYNPIPITDTVGNNGAHTSGFNEGNQSFQQHPQSQDPTTAAYQAYYYYYYYQQLQQQQQQWYNHGHISIASSTTSSYPQSLPVSTTATIFPHESNHSSTSSSDEVAKQIASSIVQRIMGNQQESDENTRAWNCSKTDMLVQQHPNVNTSSSTTFIKALQPDESPPPSHWKGVHANRQTAPLEDNQTSTTDASTTIRKSVLSNLTKVSSCDPILPTISTTQYREARQQYFQTVEYPRKQMALIKNLEYVHCQEELRLKAQLEQLKSSSTSSAASSIPSTNYAFTHQIDKKKQALLVSKAGIGTRQRTLTVKTFGGQQHQSNTTGSSNDRSSTAHQDTSRTSIYVSGLVPPQSKEETLRQLFHSYSTNGTEPLITFYKNSQTGVWKGDALIVYEGDNVPNIQDICLQVSY